jgi:hypothetical protein
MTLTELIPIAASALPCRPATGTMIGMARPRRRWRVIKWIGVTATVLITAAGAFLTLVGVLCGETNRCRPSARRSDIADGVQSVAGCFLDSHGACPWKSERSEILLGRSTSYGPLLLDDDAFQGEAMDNPGLAALPRRRRPNRMPLLLRPPPRPAALLPALRVRSDGECERGLF